MNSPPTWKIIHEDGRIEEFFDIRRKVGNRVIRAYLLKGLMQNGPTITIEGKLRGPKDEFKDLTKFAVLEWSRGGERARLLVESGVYDNLRIVGTDTRGLLEADPEEVIRAFTEVLMRPENHNATLILSIDSRVRPE